MIDDDEFLIKVKKRKLTKTPVRNIIRENLSKIKLSLENKVSQRDIYKEFKSEKIKVGSLSGFNSALKYVIGEHTINMSNNDVIKPKLHSDHIIVKDTNNSKNINLHETKQSEFDVEDNSIVVLHDDKDTENLIYPDQNQNIGRLVVINVPHSSGSPPPLGVQGRPNAYRAPPSTRDDLLKMMEDD